MLLDPTIKSYRIQGHPSKSGIKTAIHDDARCSVLFIINSTIVWG